MSHPIIIVPARWASERFPGKPLAPIKGATGSARPLVLRTVDAARTVNGCSAFVATDDARIRHVVEEAGSAVAMTSPDCRNGTERVAEASRDLPDDAIVVNVQGDAPLTPPWYVEALLEAMEADPSIEVATPVLRTADDHLDRLMADRKEGRVGATTAVTDRAGRALYFSKEILPFGAVGGAVLHHVGVYAYRRRALMRYVALPQGCAEAAEGLEQLRFLENGIPVQCVEVDARGRRFWEVNNPSDVAEVEAILKAEGIP
ncbi:MAG: manno-octulosonate cytidylyltransferase [Pseudomonadota bacterium]